MIFFGYFSFCLIYLEFKRQTRLYALVLSLHTSFQTIMVKIYTHFQTKTIQKPYPLEQHIQI